MVLGALIVMAYTLFSNNSATALARSPLSLESDQKHPVMLTKGRALGQARVMWDFFFNKPAGTRVHREIPVQAMTEAQLLAAPDNTVYRLGHSTVLMKLNNAFWITDPMFSGRASPAAVRGTGAVSRAASQHRGTAGRSKGSSSPTTITTTWIVTPS